VVSRNPKAKNKTQIVRGRVKEVAGKVSGNDRLADEVQVDQAKGHLKQAGEKVEDALKE
jgi:uncharacterized protein YjbJ (UPF0337 family)